MGILERDYMRRRSDEDGADGGDPVSRTDSEALADRVLARSRGWIRWVAIALLLLMAAAVVVALMSGGKH